MISYDPLIITPFLPDERKYCRKVVRSNDSFGKKYTLEEHCVSILFVANLVTWVFTCTNAWIQLECHYCRFKINHTKPRCLLRQKHHWSLHSDSDQGSRLSEERIDGKEVENKQTLKIKMPSAFTESLQTSLRGWGADLARMEWTWLRLCISLKPWYFEGRKLNFRPKTQCFPSAFKQNL